MENAFSHSSLSFVFRPRLHGNVVAWKMTASESEKSRPAIENILRWEDDGGPVSETGTPLPQVTETNTPQLMDVARK